MIEKRVELLAHRYYFHNYLFYYLYIPSKILKNKINQRILECQEQEVGNILIVLPFITS